MWKFARIRLRLSSEEFWGLSPREFDALADEFATAERLANFRAGLTAAIWCSTAEKTVSPLSFFSEGKSAPVYDKQLTNEQVDQVFKEIREAVGVFNRERGVT